MQLDHRELAVDKEQEELLEQLDQKVQPELVDKKVKLVELVLVEQKDHRV